MNKMDEKEKNAFLAASGYRTWRKKMLCSCSLKAFYELLESKITYGESGSDEEAIISEFLATLEDELPDVRFLLSLTFMIV